MKKKIALVTGGYSGEAEISYKSAITVGNNIPREKFDIYIIDITQNGWFYIDENNNKSIVDKEDFSIIANDVKINFDAVLMCIHGTYFDMINLPYTSCDAATSAITFNKRYTVAVAAFGGINVAKSIHLFKHTPIAADTILQQLQLPLFVKPNNGGSSLGMSKVIDGNNLQTAIDKAFAVDNQVLVEEMIVGREFTVGVFKTLGEIKVLPITEIITHNEFFDYEAKYLGKSKEVTPADISDDIQTELADTAKKVYELLNCSGVVRIDFIYSNIQHKAYMLEVNTVPGQSQASIIPQQVIAMGWTLEQFYTGIIENVLGKS
jgi:D-alanine-D-alanine ligase